MTRGSVSVAVIVVDTKYQHSSVHVAKQFSCCQELRLRRGRYIFIINGKYLR